MKYLLLSINNTINNYIMSSGNRYVEGLKKYDSRPRNPIVVTNPLQSAEFKKKFLFEQQLLEERVQAARAGVERTNLMHGSSLMSDSGPVSQQLDYGIPPAFFLAAQRIS